MKRQHPLKQPSFALAAGLLTPLAFSPFGFWPIQIIAMATLAGIILRTESPRTALVAGWAYGLGHLAAGLYWLTVSMHTYGGMNIILAAIAVCLLAIFLGTPYGLACMLTRFLANRWQAGTGITSLLIFPAFWTLAEWTRGWIATGLPWLAGGYAHTDSPLAGYAPIAGIYGISFIDAIAAGAIAFFFRIERQRWKTSLATIAATLILTFGGGTILRHIDWTHPHGEPIRVRLLQGNVPQEFKFSPWQIHSALAMYTGMITASPADLTVTPETAIPVYPHQLPDNYLDRLATYTAETGTRLAIGIPLADSQTEYTNSLVLMTPESADTPGHFRYRYNKHHLVPFGEFIPTGFRWFVNLMRIPLGDFTRGEALQKPFRIKDQWILPNICYEDIFGEEIAAQIRNEYNAGTPTPTILLNISNIAWFGDTIALPQHLQISRMRSLETGRPMLRATNTGATAIIGPKGDIIAQLPAYTRGTLDLAVQGMRGATPYIRFGNILILLVTILTLATANIIAARKRA